MNDRFLRACRREPVDRTPVWLMRQAGRYLPEYRALRAKHDFLEMTRAPELAAEVTLQPVRRFGMDAAILFADILTPIAGAGYEVAFSPGPVMARPVRSEADLALLLRFDPEEAVPETLETIRLLRRELDVPLIGFAGAPFTLACYLVDGKGTKDFALTRGLLYRDPDFGRRLLDALAASLVAYGLAQVRAGAQALQVFDTWGGLLGEREYEEFNVPVLRRVFAELRPAGVPLIYYMNGPARLDVAGSLGADVVGIDWRTCMAGARRALEGVAAVQGNLDPLALLAPEEVVRERVRDVLRRAGPGPGHVFNVGHGIHKDTPPESVAVLVEAVRRGAAE